MTNDTRRHAMAACAASLVLAGGLLPFPANAQEVVMPFTLTSPAFDGGATIPVPYTCKGTDVSPPLAWTDPPEGTVNFALIVDDPDAPSGTWVHWVLYRLSGEVRELPEQLPKDAELASGVLQGVNDFRRTGYGGPCPPPGPPHRYFFKLYALDAVLSIASGATKAELEGAMSGHILGEAQLIGLFQR